jgi:hypothetical protein
MKDRSNLDAEIFTLHTFVHILDYISEGALENSLSRDEISNAILGLGVIIKLHAYKMHDTMTQCFKLDENCWKHQEKNN